MFMLLLKDKTYHLKPFYFCSHLPIRCVGGVLDPTMGEPQHKLQFLLLIKVFLVVPGGPFYTKPNKSFRSDDITNTFQSFITPFIRAWVLAANWVYLDSKSRIWAVSGHQSQVCPNHWHSIQYKTLMKGVVSPWNVLDILYNSFAMTAWSSP